MSKTVHPERVEELKKIAAQVRVDVVAMLAKAKSGHPGGSLSMVDIVVALFFELLRHDPKNPQWEGRDRFHLSKGHAAPALYAILARCGYFATEELLRLREFGSMLQGHPHPKTPGIEVASGSLGQGLSIASGMAIAEKLESKPNKVCAVLGDGELQEGQVWEAAMFAAHYRLDNLYVFVDANGLQIDGKVEDIMHVNPIAKKWLSFGFEVREIDGHDIQAIIDTFYELEEVTGKPKVIVARTIKGKGVSFMEHNIGFHGKTPNDDETNKALNELRGEGQ